MTPYMMPFAARFIAFFAGIIYGARLPAWAGEMRDALVPIQDSTAMDPAGAKLMMISIGLLVTVVLTLFTVTIVFMVKGKKKPASNPNTDVE